MHRDVLEDLHGKVVLVMHRNAHLADLVLGEGAREGGDGDTEFGIQPLPLHRRQRSCLHRCAVLLVVIIAQPHLWTTVALVSPSITLNNASQKARPNLLHLCARNEVSVTKGHGAITSVPCTEAEHNCC